MRFSTLALFIVLPAAAYAAAADPNDNGKKQTDTGANNAKTDPAPVGGCIQQAVGCVLDSPTPDCCSGLKCKLNSVGAPVCFIAYLVQFRLFTELNAAMPPLMPPSGELELEVGRGILWIRRMSRSWL